MHFLDAMLTLFTLVGGSGGGGGHKMTALTLNIADVLAMQAKTNRLCVTFPTVNVLHA